MLNSIVIQGRLTRDPELRRTQDGNAVTNFTLAVERDHEKKTDFIDCVAWRQAAEFMGKYGAKGRMSVVIGRLQFRDWTDKEGNKRTVTEVVADRVYLIDNPPKAEQKQADPAGDVYPALTADDFAELEGEDELPF